MTHMDHAERQDMIEELSRLRERVAELEKKLSGPPPHWQASEFYTTYYVLAGAVLGMFGAIVSLLLNVIGAALLNMHPLQLIRVYLTFPLGQRALTNDFDTGVALAIGCCLYIGTGMLLGIPFQLILTRFADRSVAGRFAAATVLSLAIWLINYYAILGWLQPLLIGGNWIVSEIPTWVAVLTHLVFGWTMAAHPLGRYVPYRRQSEIS